MQISFIITVFNKENELPATIASILRQKIDIASDDIEYVFVDDASQDSSIQVIEDAFKKLDNVHIIQNQKNLGPSVRLNQGAMAASGKCLFLMDADDILINDALQVMHSAICKENADFVFGFQKKSELSQDQLLEKNLPLDTDYHISTKPLDTILHGKYVRMSYLVTKELYTKSHGADERIFIQDESLPLRLGCHAEKMISLAEPAIYAPKSAQDLSKNKMQQIHDKFYAYYFALQDFDSANLESKTKIYKTAISAIWKAKKKNGNLLGKIFFFILYIMTKIRPTNPNIKILDKYKNFIDGLKNVRKI